jgi:CheY-like chemotaxis protein
LKVLLVDDESLIRSSTAEILSELGHTVLEAGDAAAALAIIEAEAIDVLLTDIGLPGMSGSDLAAEARRRVPGMELLRLIALDEDDLKVISAQLQDALVRIDDLAFLPKERRFAAMVKRFDWLKVVSGDVAAADAPLYERREAALRFERVLSAKYRNLPLDKKAGVEVLLAVDFEPGDAPGGFVNLIFAGGGGIRLEVECIEAEMRDLGTVWRTRNKPEHPDGPDKPRSAS